MPSKREPSAFSKLPLLHQDAVIAYTDPKSPTRGVKGRSTAVAYPDMTPESAQAHSARLFRKDTVKSALAEILEKAHAGYEVRATHMADIAMGRLEISTITEQYGYKEGARYLMGEQVVTRPVDAAVQVTALKKISKDTGEDIVVGVQNRLIEEHMLDAGRKLLKTHQRGLVAPQAAAEPESDTDAPLDSVEQRESDASGTEPLANTSTLPNSDDCSETDSHHVSNGAQVRGSGTGARGGTGGPIPSIPSPLTTYDGKNSDPPELPLLAEGWGDA